VTRHVTVTTGAEKEVPARGFSVLAAPWSVERDEGQCGEVDTVGAADSLRRVQRLCPLGSVAMLACNLQSLLYSLLFADALPTFEDSPSVKVENSAVFRVVHSDKVLVHHPRCSPGADTVCHSLIALIRADGVPEEEID